MSRIPTPVSEEQSLRLGEIAAADLLGNFIYRANLKLCERRDDVREFVFTII